MINKWGCFRFFNIVSVQNYNPVPPPPPPPPQAPPPARLFKLREIQLEKEVDQQATGDIPPLEWGRESVQKKSQR